MGLGASQQIDLYPCNSGSRAQDRARGNRGSPLRANLTEGPPSYSGPPEVKRLPTGSFSLRVICPRNESNTWHSAANVDRFLIYEELQTRLAVLRQSGAGLFDAAERH
jgi:hypothetical protein